ncbi:MAG: hypothetical protein JRJ08_06055 [Deltaproteobacteria bacterium]|nr:hypothetical protein [Deltaproteobacteria bacterium]
MENSSDFKSEKKDGQRRWYRQGFPIEEVLDRISDLNKGGKTGAQILKVTKKSRVMLITVGEKPSLTHVCVKEYFAHQWSSKLKAVFGYSRSRIARLNAHNLIFNSIPTATPLAFIEEKSGLFPRRSVLISEDLSRLTRIDYYILKEFRDTWQTETKFQEKYLFIKCLSNAIRDLHDKQVYFGDLKAPNILVEKLKDSWKFYFVDTDRITFNRRISVRRMAKNFAQLHTSIPVCMSRSDRIRFFLYYYKNNHLLTRQKELIRRIIKESKKRLTVEMTPLD